MNRTPNRKSSHLIRFANLDVLHVFSPEREMVRQNASLATLGSNLSDRIAAARAAERKAVS